MIIDGHCDTLSVCLDTNKSLKDKDLNFNIIDAQLLKTPVIQMMAVYISPQKYVVKGKNKAWERTCNILNEFDKQKEILKNEIIQINSLKDIEQVIKMQKTGVILTIENGSAICGQLKRIEELHNKGIKVMSITWNNDNELGCGAYTTNDTGLAKLGREYIKKLQEKNIFIDISHSSEKTFWDTAKLTTKPIVATHSCVYKICSNERNLTNEQIKEIAKSNGIIGICFYSKFLNSINKATIKDVVKHIKHIVNLVGINYVGFGTDFDGVNKNDLPLGITGIKDMNKVIKELQLQGFSKQEIEKITGINWLRVLYR